MEQDFKEYLQVLIRKSWLIVAIVVVACGLTALYGTYYSKPVYEAETKLIINTSNKTTQGTVQPDSNLISSNIMLIDTYKEIIATPAIMDKVAAKLPNVPLTVQELISRVKITSSDGSQVMSISLRDPSYDQAVTIVNAISEVVRSEIPRIMNVDNVTILSEAKLTDDASPVSLGMTFKILIAFVLSFLGSIGIVLLIEYLDDTLKTDRDIRDIFDKPTLTVISRMKKSDLSLPVNQPNKKRVGEISHAGSKQ